MDNPEMKELTPATVNKTAMISSIVFVIIGITVFLLWKFRPALPCMACEKGSWWYKCQSGTGAGTVTCKRVIEGQISINDIIDKTEDIAEKIALIQGKIKEPVAAVGRAAANMQQAITNAMDAYNPVGVMIDSIDRMGDIVPKVGDMTLNLLDEFGEVGAITRAALEEIGFDKLTMNLAKPINEVLQVAAAPVKEGLKAGATVLGKGMEAAWEGALQPFNAMAHQIHKEWDEMAGVWRPVASELSKLKAEVLEVLTSIQKDVSDVMWFAMIRSIQAIFPGLPVVMIIFIIALVAFMVISGSIYGAVKFASAPVRMLT